MPAFLEPNPRARRSFILRGGAEATEYGKPYEWSGTVISCWRWPWSKKRAAKVVGFARSSNDPMSTKQVFQDIKDCLGRAGFTHWQWERRKPGEPQSRWFEYSTKS